MAKLTDVDPFACSLYDMVAMIHERFENLSADSSPLPSASFFAPYLRSLPEMYSLPLWWPDEMVDRELRGTDLHFIAQERRGLLREMLSVVTKASEADKVSPRGSLTCTAFPRQKGSKNGSGSQTVQKIQAIRCSRLSATQTKLLLKESRSFRLEIHEWKNVKRVCDQFLIWSGRIIDQHI
ncbi:hypothetical protein BJ742DRAFT_63987 [Cladochytrium replicatum]|nr:hypothetical protein BJ742DRAFT_63987 [Cladochytrium replicatum]